MQSAGMCLAINVAVVRAWAAKEGHMADEPRIYEVRVKLHKERYTVTMLARAFDRHMVVTTTDKEPQAALSTVTARLGSRVAELKAAQV
jgi:hypothetical protein